MSKSFLMGNEAIGLGAVRAGVQVVSGYPGTPSTEVLETVAKHNPGDIYVEWSVNEKRVWRWLQPPPTQAQGPWSQ